ncbi:ABC transporter ATP-binding protein [Kocuria tytonis]|uniref:ABC transporter ATP-binding protein n=1 Tax=Kocuria tytonis TaxID=2054280 RepID=A0A495A8S7_9MICC|nr:ABC transporter ATP-binding protein [Kocuria tytonis]RKQ36451.1 ABC transporter ATP-binding protein [Kocuria tytonis]
MPTQPEHTTRPAAPPDAGTAALRISDLVKTFEGRGEPVHAVRGLSMAAHAGRITALLGANGAGKSTTLQCAQGLQQPTAGSVRLLGADPWRAAPDLRARVGVMLQDGGLPQAVRPGELLRHVSRLYADPVPAPELMDVLGIGSFAHTPVRRLSGGQKQRVALAAALVGRPEVLFLDEPSAGLDPRSRHLVFELVQRLRDRGTCIILTTHLMDDAARLADYVYILDRGTVAAQGTVAELVSAQRDAPLVMTVTLAPEHAAALRADPPWRTPRFHDIAWTVKDRTVTLTGPLDAGHVREITAWATRNETLPEALSVQPRSLEDVFLDVSGRDLP